VKKEKISEDTKKTILGRITTTTDLKDMASVDFVVEAAVEREDLKFKIFEDLDKICPSHVILSTNTSSIPIGRIAPTLLPYLLAELPPEHQGPTR